MELHQLMEGGPVVTSTSTRSWDSIARRYVEHDTLPQETFGPLRQDLRDGKVTVNDARRAEGLAPHPSNVLRPRTEDEFPYIRSLIANDNKSTTPRADRRGAYITTYKGRFWPFAPQAADVFIEDIAHSLSMQCRYAGHGERFYSVAEHSVHLARWCQKFGSHVALTALLHDATEAYLVDVPRPVKAHLVGYKEAEIEVWRAIAKRFDLDINLPTVVHEADGRICADEMRANLHEVDPNVGPPLGVTLEFWTPGVAEIYFLDMFSKLVEAAKVEKMGEAA